MQGDYIFSTGTSFALGYLPYIILGLVFIGVTALQVFLSFRKARYFGFILPAAFFVASIPIIIANVSGATAWQSGVDTIVFSLISNIPACLMIAIYFLIKRIIKARKGQPS